MPILDNPFLGIFFGSENQKNELGSSNQPMRIMHAPGHVNTALVHSAESIAKLNPLSFGRTEMYREGSITTLRNHIPTHKICIPPKTDTHSQENPIGLRNGKDIKFEGNRNLRLSEDAGGDNGNDRWCNIVTFSFMGDKFFHMATHWNPHLQFHPGGLIRSSEPRVQAMVHAFEVMQNEASKLISQGREGFITGDFNYFHPIPPIKLWKYSPQMLFNSLHMHHFEKGLDYIAWTSGMAQTSPVRVIDRFSNIDPSDHPWLIGHFVKRENK